MGWGEDGDGGLGPGEFDLIVHGRLGLGGGGGGMIHKERERGNSGK